MDILKQRFEEYCEGCPEIEPRFIKGCLYGDNKVVDLVNVTVYCEKENFCKAIYSRLAKHGTPKT